MNKRFLVFLPLLITVVACSQQNYLSCAGFKYREFVLNAEKATADLPLIIGFHFSSSNPEDALEDYDQLTIPVRIIIPKGNFIKREGYSYFPPEYYLQDSLTQQTMAMQTVDSLSVFVEALATKYQRKAVVSGFSQGGDISFLLAIYHPKFLKASFPLAGFIHTQAFDNIKRHAHKSVPINIYQGMDDAIVSIKYKKKR